MSSAVRRASEGGERDAAVRVEAGCGQDLGDGKEHEQPDRGDDQRDRGHDEDVAAHGAAAGEAGREEEEQGGGRDERAVAHAGLRIDRAEERLKAGEIPAAQADREALERHPGEAEDAGRDQDGGGSRIAAPAAEREDRRHEGEDDRPEPRAAVKHRLQERRGCLGVRRANRASQTTRSPASTAYQGRTMRADPSERPARGPADRATALFTECWRRCGRRNDTPPAERMRQFAPISASHFESSRVRSSDEPYFAKS